MLISELVENLMDIKNKYDDLQVAVYDGEFSNHDPVFHIEVAKKEDDCNEPFETSEILNDTFLSIRSYL